MKKMITLFSMMVLSSSAFAASGLNPKSNVSKVYEFWMGTKADCSNMVKVIDLGTSGKEVDTEQGVDVGSGTLPSAGTYNCLAIVVDDANTMQPATSSGGCVSTKHYIHRTFGGSDKSVLPGDVAAWVAGDSSKQINPDGKWVTGNFATQKVAAYFSTAGTNGNSGHYPANALPLAGGAVTVGADSMSKTFFVNCAGQVQDGDSRTLIVEDSTVTADGSSTGQGCATNACAVGFR